HDRLSEVDLVACFQAGSAGIAVDFDAGALANNAEAAIGAALVPAVVENAILAGFSVVVDMRVLACDGSIGVLIRDEGQIVSAVHSSVAVDVDLAPDVSARLVQEQLIDRGVSPADHETCLGCDARHVARPDRYAEP